jgi:hypothetical protein
VNPPFDQPYSFFIAELFKVQDGKINRMGCTPAGPLRSNDEVI